MLRVLRLLIIGTMAGHAAVAQSILVAPFTNRSADATLDWIGESISEDIQRTLASSKVSTVSREEWDRAAGRLSLRRSSRMTLAGVIKVAEEAGASTIVSGYFDVTPDPEADAGRGSLRIVASVLERASAAEKARFSESGLFEDLGVIQREAALQVLRSVRPDDLPLRRADIEQVPPVIQINALENYIRGLIAPAEEQRHRYFTQAARIDPTFSKPALALARMYWPKQEYGTVIRWLAAIGPSDDEYTESLFMLGLSRYHQGDFRMAVEDFGELARLVPEPEIINDYGAIQIELDTQAAIENLRSVVQLVPGDPDYLFNLGYALWIRGAYDEAADLFRSVLDRSSNDQDSLFLLGRCLQRSGPRAGELRTTGLQRLKEEWGDWSQKGTARP